MYGLHGGPSWYGGTLDLNNDQIIIPSNHYPWVLRSYYYDRLLTKVINLNEKFFHSFQKITTPLLSKKNLKNLQVKQ